MTLSVSKTCLTTTAAACLMLGACGNAEAPQSQKKVSIEKTQTADETRGDMADKKMADKKISQEKMTDAKEGKTGTEAGSDINAPYNAFLKTYVVPSGGINLVKYAQVSDADRKSLQDYITTLESQDPTSMDKNAEMAFWFNLYNAKTVDVILANYPVKSIKKIDGRGPWKKKIVTVNGNPMSLDNIEHDTVRAKYNEPRVHYAFNCASIGCPDLKASAWEGATLDADLTRAAQSFIASSRGVEIKGDDIKVSEIFKWYKDDFGSNEDDLKMHLATYAGADKAAAIKAADDIKYDYDWNLNIAK